MTPSLVASAPRAVDLALNVDPEVDEHAAPSGHSALTMDRVSDDFLRLIPRDFARAHLLISQETIQDGAIERLCVAASTSAAAIHNVGTRLGRRCESFIAGGEGIAQLIDAAYGARTGRTDAGDTGAIGRGVENESDDFNVDRLLQMADRDLLSTQGKGPVVKLVDAIIFEAISRGASDVHVQPLEDRTLIRYRLDGVLHTVRELEGSKQLTYAIISRIKVMGHMDIAERRMPQDGRATVDIGPRNVPNHASAVRNGVDPSNSELPGGRSIDLRISTLPTSYGERAVVRLLDASQQRCEFATLGMPPDTAEMFLACARRSSGIILLTGPTGSGKTTTLYATLRAVGSPALNIMTIEDPVEYDLSSAGLPISQAQVNLKKGVTFASGLRHILRQDPDIVMIGEIRDAETARIAIQASLTGHLVFSTLHTNDAASAVSRLIDLGIEPYLVSASLTAVLAQRLVRLMHQNCCGTGCEGCFGTGMLGRTGLYELLVIDEHLRTLIARDVEAGELRRHAREHGMRTLHEEGERLIEDGRSPLVEVRRVVQELL